MVGLPFGSTEPLSVADDTVTDDAEPVTTAGGTSVVKTPSEPRLVPAVEVATTR